MGIDENGGFAFTTVKPGAVPGPDGKMQAPHIAVSVFMRGLLRRLVTRIYFPDEAANSGDFILNLIEPGRRGTLVAKRTAGQTGMLEWDVNLQGPDETVFFDCGM
jgi:protocatechuate 3,4-dioxygenase alpha subunit